MIFFFILSIEPEPVNSKRHLPLTVTCSKICRRYYGYHSSAVPVLRSTGTSIQLNDMTDLIRSLIHVPRIVLILLSLAQRTTDKKMVATTPSSIRRERKRGKQPNIRLPLSNNTKKITQSIHCQEEEKGKGIFRVLDR